MTDLRVAQDSSAARTASWIGRFPWVTTTIAIAAIAGGLSFTPWSVTATWLLTAYVLTVAGRSAWGMLRALRAGTFGVDIIAVTAIVATVLVGELWAALVIVLMLTTGEALESYAAGRATRDLRALLSRNPRTAHRIGPSGDADDIPIDDITVGVHILVRADEVVPVDGTLISDAGVFDESSLTGESLPVEKTSGDEVLSGSVNGSAAIVLQTTRAAADSQYQQIVALVESAAATKAPMVRLADRFALPFAITAYALAGLAWWVSGEPTRFAEVLVVATPCPLIIAAPVAFMAGMSRAARRGVIIRSSASLEKLRRARTFAFDKTGTLTRGTPRLVDVRAMTAFTPEDVLRSAASAEVNSAHILAAAAIAGARERGIATAPSTDATEATAAGITATVERRRVVVGKRDFVASNVRDDVARTILTGGEIAVYVGVDDRFAGVLVFRDQVRENALPTLMRLRERGARHFIMLTGDDTATAAYIAGVLEIDDVHAACLPSDKVAVVAQAGDRPVVMVGDGVNDAPVLAAADVGVAMGARGATAASEAADVVILADDIGRVADAVDIGTETVDVALQSIWIGIGLSTALMVVAAFGWIPALVGAWSQEAIDVIAIAWALRATRSL